MILTDREIKIAISRRLIEIDPVPDSETAFSSTAVDLTLDARIRIFKPAEPGVLKIIDPTQAGFDANETIGAITTSQKIASKGFDLPPKVLILAWTAEFVGLATETRIAARRSARRRAA